MTLERSVEYDAFGPWILQVTGADEVPRAFRDYPFDFDTAEFVLKLPRDIARRDANPSMHLYDRMLIVDPTGLTVLVRVDDSFGSSTTPAATIVAVEQSSELLDGLLTVYALDGTRTDVPFNGSSKTTIATVATRLVELAGAALDDPLPSERMDLQHLGPDDIALVNAYRDAASATPGLRVRAAYPGSAPASTESLFARVLKGRARLSGAVVCSTDRQLVVVSRRAWLRYRAKPDLSTKRTVIVWDRVTRVESFAHPLVHDVVQVTVTMGAAALQFAMPRALDGILAQA